jgi:hypothetical protein
MDLFATLFLFMLSLIPRHHSLFTNSTGRMVAAGYFDKSELANIVLEIEFGFGEKSLFRI